MLVLDDEGRETKPHGFVLGLLVLGISCACSNYVSLPLQPGAAIEERMTSSTIGVLFTVGYGVQLAAGGWLGLALVLDVRRRIRIAFGAWLLGISLFLVPLPTVHDDPLAAPLVLVVAVLVGTLARALDRATREHAA